MRLEDDQLEQLAQRVAELLRPAVPDGRLVDAATVAAALGIAREIVYQHKHVLGGFPIGTGPRPRWRFDLAVALAADLRTAAPTPADEAGPEAGPRPRRRARRGRHGDLLPIGGHG